MRRIAVAACAVVLAVVSQAGAAERHPFNAHDLVSMDRLSAPVVSPDGAWIVFGVSSVDLDKNGRSTDLWLVGTRGGATRRLTTHEAGDHSPHWSPDGTTVWFLSSRSGSSQVWKIPFDGGEATQVTRLPLDVSTFRLSPDGSRLAVSMDVYPACETIRCTESWLEKVSERKSSGIVFDKLFIRHWDTWKDGRRSHVFVLPAEGGEPVDVMQGMDADCPSKPFGGVEEYAFSPDGRHVVFTARDAGLEEAWSTNFDLYAAPADGSSPPRNLTAGNPAWDTGPVFSPDGKTLAYLAMSRAGYESDRRRIVLRAWPEGPERVLADSWDRSPGSLTWSADGTTIYADAQNLGNHSLFAIDVASGKVREVVREGNARSAAVAGGRIFYSLAHFRSPAELYSVNPDGSDARRLTGFNDDRLAAVQMGEPEQFTFEGWNGEKVYAWIMKPVGFDPDRKFPVAFLIHGGPQGSFGNGFHYRWNPQSYAAAGYACVMVDFHGSVGYGQAFTDSIRGDWGGKPLEDLKKGLDAALARYPWMDRDRVSALGASFGGFMVNWIAGQWPDRFRSLVSHDGNLDERMAYYNTEELWFPEWDHEGTPWENPEGYLIHNPVDHVDRWKTPMLVIHGALDYRVVDTQGMSVFTALQRRGIPSRLLYFPDENHWVLKPHNSILWHETVIDWIDRFTKP